MENYNIELYRYRLETDQFKTKQITILLNSIMGSRLNNSITFTNCAKVTFANEDDKRQFAIFENQEPDCRTKVNSLVFDINPNITDKFNKLLLIHSNGHIHGYYHYILYNTETHKTQHQYFIDHDINSLFSSMNRAFNNFNRNPENRLMYV